MMRLNLGDKSSYSIFFGKGMSSFTPGHVKGSGEKVNVFVGFEILSIDHRNAGQYPHMQCNGALNLPFQLALRWLFYDPDE